MKAYDQKNTFIKTVINGWTVLHRQAVSPKNAHKEPIIILAGFGASFDDHSIEIEKLALEHPIYLVHLPGFGESKESGAELTYPAYALLLSTFLETLGVNQCTLIAHTYTANIAVTFSGQYLAKVSKIILVAPVMKMRDSVRFVMKKSIQSLDNGDIKSFAASQAIHFVPTFTEEYSFKRKEIVKDYYLSLLNYKDIRAEQFKSHVSRLDKLTENHSYFNGIRDCETLVISGERDLLTSPEDAFNFSKLCSESTFALVDGADHLLAKENANVLTRIYKRYLEKKPLKRMRGLRVLDSAFLDRKYIRVTSRYDINENGSVKLNNGKEYQVTFENISGFGCMFKIIDGDGGVDKSNFQESGSSLVLDFCDVSLDVEVLQSHSDTEFRGVFSFSSFEQHEKLHTYLDTIS